MLIKIRQYFNQFLLIEDASNEDSIEQTLQLAAAALLIETCRADYSLDQRELDTVMAALEKSFKLERKAVEALIQLADEEVDQASSLYQFTRLVNDFYSYEHKLQLIGSMWEVAYADGQLDKYEEHFIRKVAELTYVAHNDFIRLKLAADMVKAIG